MGMGREGARGQGGGGQRLGEMGSQSAGSGVSAALEKPGYEKDAHKDGAPLPRNPLKVLLIGHQFQVPSEGQAKAAALSAFSDLAVHVLCPERYREAEVRWRAALEPKSPRYQFRTTPVQNAWCGPAKWYLQWYPELKQRLLALKPDIVDLWEEPWNLLSAQVSRLCSRFLPDCRLISETEQNISKRLPPPFEWFRMQTLGRASYVVARNREALAVTRGKGYAGPARVVGNGVDTLLFRPLDRALCRQGAGLHGFVVGYAGRLVEEKGLLSLLRAFRKIKGPRFLYLCGEGPLLEQMLQEPFVKWAGAVPREKLPWFYNALDVLVLPSLTTASWKEQFGRVLVEAQACGIPVLGSNSGAIPEVIGDAGIVFPENDDVAMLAALDRLRLETGLRDLFSQAGRLQATRLYSWEAIAGQMREIYLQLPTVV